MPRNEAQTRFELIDPALTEQCGWARADIRIEETAAPVDVVYKKGKRRPKGRTDYVLRHPLRPDTEPIPMAIIEAKAENLPPQHGLQQGKGYLVGELHKVPFVFSSNGHQFVEYDTATGITSEPRLMNQFPKPQELVARYLARLNVSPAEPALQLLTTSYAQGRDYLRYYQDAAIRATFEKIILVKREGKPPRVLLSLATGSGKTRIAAALLRRMFDAGMLGKALVLCDRTELRDNSLGDFQAAFGTDAAEVDTRNPQKNARVLIATYQTLDKSQPGNKDANFFLKHYPPDYFDVIVIDECHRSAWGDWHLILTQNSKAIQIGLTATPREIKLPETHDAVTKQGIEEDRKRLADNYKYFGDPVYEYTYLQGVEDGYLAPTDIEQYDLFHDGHLDPERIRGVLRGDVQGKNLTNALTGQAVSPDSVAERTEGSALEQTLILPERVSAMCQHLFARILDTGDKDPLQKTIIFCASDHHADLVAIELNNIYAKWCAANHQKRVDTYAFKCMSSVGGQEMIPDFRNRQRSHIIATTKDLLSTGVNVPCVRNIVFFRYLQSPILFHQMIGRGTRIDEETGKLIFHIFDYTGATALFGTDFITKPPPEPPKDPKPPGPPPPPPINVKGVAIEIQDNGRFNLMNVDGQMTRVTPAQYQQHLIDQLISLVPSIEDFRARWLDPEKRKQLMHDLAQQGLWPERLREAAKMDDYDLFDVVAALAYRVEPMKRSERAAKFGNGGPDWLVRLPQPSAKVIRAIVRQFEKAGTDALEAKELWETPEIKQADGLKALKQGGAPAELLKKTKEGLFAA